VGGGPTRSAGCRGTAWNGKPVLVYDNYKANRPGRRLPIGAGTAELVTEQKNRVRARFPDTPVA
jgi:hypothetical protein